MSEDPKKIDPSEVAAAQALRDRGDWTNIDGDKTNSTPAAPRDRYVGYFNPSAYQPGPVVHPLVHPLVRAGVPAHFKLSGGQWHRTECYGTPCTCGVPSSQATHVMPAIDDSWKYSPDHNWAPCIAKLANREEFHESQNVGADGVVLQPGMRVQFTQQAAWLYEQGSAGEWFVEMVGGAIGPTDLSFGRAVASEMLRLVDRKTGVFVRAPLTWVEQWKPTVREEQPMVDMSEVAAPEVPITVSFSLEPSEDSQITCVFCFKEKVTHEFSTLKDGRRSWLGVHIDCLKSIRESKVDRKHLP